MFTSLRRYEFGKMLLNTIPVLIGAGIASKLFMEVSFTIKLAIFLGGTGVSILAFFLLPEDMGKVPNSEKEK